MEKKRTQKKQKKIKLPYRVFKISGRSSWYYQILTDYPNKRVWTKRKALKNSCGLDEEQAILKLLSIMTDAGTEKNKTIESLKNFDLSDKDAKNICDFLIKKNILSTYKLKTAETGRKFIDWLLEQWEEDSKRIKELERKGKKPTYKTIFNNRNKIINHWKEFFNDLKINEITIEKMGEFSLFLSTKKLSNTSINGVLKAGLVPIRWGCKHGIFKEDISKGDYNYINDTKETIILTMEQARQFFKFPFDNPKYFLLNALACCTGMRTGEIQALQTEDLKENYILLSHNWDGKYLKEPKNGKKRKIFFAPSILWILEEIKKVSMNSHSGFIFESDDNLGIPIPNNTINRHFRNHLKKVIGEDAKNYRFYQWRHFHDTFLIGSGLSAETLARQSGHNPDMILNLYAKHETKEDTIKLMDAQTRTFSGLFE